MRRNRIAIALALGGAAALLVPLALAGGSHAERVAKGAPDFRREVAPIVREKCAGCHRLGGIAPFALRTEADVAKYAAVITAAVGDGRMPPWPPSADSPTYVGQHQRTLDAKQRDTLLRWGRAQLVTPGSPRGRTPVGAAPALAAQARPGETLLTLRAKAPYKPSARNGATDDYRCFLVDPKLTEDAFVTSTRIEPDVDAIVHHVILFRVPPERVVDAERLDAGTPGEGWTCFGGTGVRTGARGLSFLDSAGWIAAWAPGAGADRQADGTGVLLSKGSRVVMQVHYNLLNGSRPDRSRATLTTVPATQSLKPVETMLLPAPVEVPCPKGTKAPLCDRTAALFDQIQKYGSEAGLIPSGLLALCAKDPGKPPTGPISTCTRTLAAPTTIRAIGGHMHLLGTSITIELNPGTSRARVLLRIPRWDFHWQGAYFLETPVVAQPGDTLRVTCRFDATRRAQAKPPQKARYTLWGEGTADEMCLGVLQVTRD
ncbi:MAG: hypothetical protein U0R50_07895 [Gaiellales bacterium]